ncbi:hypothetical protein [Rapidithrix thailandica]
MGLFDFFKNRKKGKAQEYKEPEGKGPGALQSLPEEQTEAVAKAVKTIGYQYFEKV